MATSELARVQQRRGERYAIERDFGRGGMGTVYLARDLRLDGAVALKVLPAASCSTCRCASGSCASPDA